MVTLDKKPLSKQHCLAVKKEQEPRYDEDYYFLMDLAIDSVRRGKRDRAAIIIQHMVEKWPERVIRYHDSVPAKEPKPRVGQSSNP